MKRTIFIIAALAVGFAIGRITARPTVRVETRTEYREIVSQAIRPSSVSVPIGSRIERVKLIFVRNDNTDSLQPDDYVNGLSPDSAIVELPIRDFTFTDDSTYRIIARGAYVENLPEVRFFPKYETAVVTTARRTRLEHGIQLGAGAALTPEGLQPALYFGYGFTLKF